jgi:hypothetical protein
LKPGCDPLSLPVVQASEAVGSVLHEVEALGRAAATTPASDLILQHLHRTGRGMRSSRFVSVLMIR